MKPDFFETGKENSSFGKAYSDGAHPGRTAVGMRRRGRLILPLLLTAGLVLTACGSTSAPASDQSAAAEAQADSTGDQSAAESGDAQDQLSDGANGSAGGEAGAASDSTESASAPEGLAPDAEASGKKSGTDLNGPNSKGLNKEEMARVCLYREERDPYFDSDLAKVRERVNVLTEGRFLMEETVLKRPEGEKDFPAVDIYIPGDCYGDRNFQDVVRAQINRQGRLSLAAANGVAGNTYYTDKVPLGRSGIERVERLYGCPESVKPLDYGISEKEFAYLKITLSEGFCKNSSKIWDWERIGLLQDAENNESYANVAVIPDKESRSLYWLAPGATDTYLDTFVYLYTHEPLKNSFYFIASPVMEWDSGEAVTGARQIESGDFTTASVVNVFKMVQASCSDSDWEQTRQAIRERLDAAGITYAMGHLKDQERSIVLRTEAGKFSDELLEQVMVMPAITLSVCSREIKVNLPEIKCTVGEKNGQKTLDLDMSALRKETLAKLSRLSSSCHGRIVLRINGQLFAWTPCSELITDGRVSLDRNGYTGEPGFEGEFEYLPEFLEALISGTPFPANASGTALVNLQMAETVYLTQEGEIWSPFLNYYSRDSRIERIKELVSDLNPREVYLAGSKKLVVRFELPEGEDQAKKVEKTLSKAVRLLKEELFTEAMYFTFVDGNDTVRLQISNGQTFSEDQWEKMFLYLTYKNEDQQLGEAVKALLKEDPKLANLYAGS